MSESGVSDHSEQGTGPSKSSSLIPLPPFKPWGLAIGAGATVPLALQPWGMPWFLPISFAVLAWALRGASIGKALWLGWLFGLAVEVFGLPWIATTVYRYLSIFVLEDPDAGLAAAAAGAAILVGAPLAAIGWGLCCASIPVCPPRLWMRAVWAGICFMLLEAYWPRLFQWTLGACYATEDPSGGWLLLQWFGVEETVLLTVAAGFLAAGAFANGRPVATDRWLLVPAILLMALSILPLPAAQPAPSSGDSASEHLTISIVQPAIPLQMRHGREGSDLQLKKIRQLIEIASDGGEAGAPSLVLLPEGILPQAWKIEWLQQWSQDWLERPTVIGLTHIEPQGYSNAVALLVPGPETVEIQIGRKKELVPFGETVPFGEFLSSIGLSVPVTELVPGTEAVVFTADDHFPPLGISICYEGILAESAAETVHQGARWHANLTEDLWYGDWLEPAQHLQIQRSRAIENGLVWLRSVNAGISAVIDPRRSGYRSIVAARSWSDGTWSRWQPRDDAGQLALPAGAVGILQVQIQPDFSPAGKAPLALPSSTPLLLIYCLLALFWGQLKLFQRSADRSSRT
ncbi:MAG: apolipoprotein N-acyltransferase [Planctomycetota bacterium]|nr:apolipoprotein N-acyltransferase [Planctomycetota bacterium]